MGKNIIRLDRKALLAITETPEVRKALNGLAHEIAENVEKQGIRVGDKDGGKHEKPLPVMVEEAEAGEHRAAVLLAHAAGIAAQAKHGALTKAVTAAGLRVREKSGDRG